jgi:large subunit ribosomal protein L24
MPKYKIRKGDTVEVISGKDKGVRGEVIKVLPQKGKVVVQGVRIQMKHYRPEQQDNRTSSGIKEIEGQLDISNVMLIDPEDDRPTRVRLERDEDGTVRRVAVRSGAYLE